MTQKRFTLWRTLDLDGHTDEWDVIDNEHLDYDEGHISEEEVVDRLNALHEENQHLKGALKELKEIGDYQAMRIHELQDENERLRKENRKLDKFQYSIFQKMGELND